FGEAGFEDAGPAHRLGVDDRGVTGGLAHEQRTVPGDLVEAGQVGVLSVVVAVGVPGGVDPFSGRGRRRCLLQGRVDVGQAAGSAVTSTEARVSPNQAVWQWASVKPGSTVAPPSDSTRSALMPSRSSSKPMIRPLKTPILLALGRSGSRVWASRSVKIASILMRPPQSGRLGRRAPRMLGSVRQWTRDSPLCASARSKASR